MSAYIRYEVRGQIDGKVYYVLSHPIVYISPRYGRAKRVPAGFHSDGATWGIDIKGSRSWWVHDAICEHPYWESGDPITAWQAATVLSDVLYAERLMKKGWKRFTRVVHSQTWRIATFVFGCIRARKNGWF